MKLYTLLPLLSVLFSSLTFTEAIIMAGYKFRTAAAKKYFDDQKGSECVQIMPDKVRVCGERDYKDKSPANRDKYAACIKELSLPKEFEEEVLNLEPADFSSLPVYEAAYTRKFQNYVEKIDAMHKGDAKENKLEFSFNWLALLLIPVAFGIVFLLNRSPATENPTKESADV